MIGTSTCGPLPCDGDTVTLRTDTEASTTLRLAFGSTRTGHMGLFLGLLLTGCASSHGFDRSAMYAALHAGVGPVAEQNAPATSPEAPTLFLPFRTALYFVQRDFPVSDTIRNAEWLVADKEALIHGLTVLRDEGIVADIFLLADSTVQGNDVRKIRRAAERYGADAVLIVEGAGSIDRYNNGHAVLYATLIGAYLASGTVSEALFLVSGSLWDARTDHLYTTQTAEGHAESIGSAILLEDRLVLAQAKKAALDEIGKRLTDELRRWRTAAPRTNDHSR